MARPSRAQEHYNTFICAARIPKEPGGYQINAFHCV